MRPHAVAGGGGPALLHWGELNGKVGGRTIERISNFSDFQFPNSPPSHPFVISFPLNTFPFRSPVPHYHEG